jgi:hypothetical protein
MVCVLSTVTFVLLRPPTYTLGFEPNLDPDSVIIDPPAVGPLVGVKEVRVGGGYVYTPVAVRPDTLMTMEEAPAPEGTVQINDVWLCDVTGHDAPPIVTVAVRPKLVPKMVIGYPPTVEHPAPHDTLLEV